MEGVGGHNNQTRGKNATRNRFWLNIKITNKLLPPKHCGRQMGQVTSLLDFLSLIRAHWSNVTWFNSAGSGCRASRIKPARVGANFYNYRCRSIFRWVPPRMNYFGPCPGILPPRPTMASSASEWWADFHQNVNQVSSLFLKLNPCQLCLPTRLDEFHHQPACVDGVQPRHN